MNERNLSRRLSTSVVEALKSQGHILVVKGGAVALARELEDLMVPRLSGIGPRLRPRAPMGAEPTSTFGDEAVDEEVELMVVKLTRALMESDHVEDVFAEDNVIRRDIFRVVRDGILHPPVETEVDEEDDEDDDLSVTVRLDELGYVAATVSKRADAKMLREALERAAQVVDARLSTFTPETREAAFELSMGGPDERLELEEAVADELADLVDLGLVGLPSVERRFDLGRPLAPTEQRALRPRIESAADATLLPSGCATTWDYADARTVRVTFTPLSDQDIHGIDAPAAAFGEEITALVASLGQPPAQGSRSAPPPPAAPPASPPEPAETTLGESTAVETPAEAPEEVDPTDDEELDAPEQEAEHAPAKKTATKKTATKKTVAKKTATKKADAEAAAPAASPKATTPRAKAATGTKPAAKRTTTTAKTTKAVAKKH